MSTICVEVDNEILNEFRTRIPELNWTITGEIMAGSRTTTLAIDAPAAPRDLDGWLCSPTIGSDDDGIYVMGYGPLRDLTRGAAQ